MHTLWDASKRMNTAPQVRNMDALKINLKAAGQMANQLNISYADQCKATLAGQLNVDISKIEIDCLKQ